MGTEVEQPIGSLLTTMARRYWPYAAFVLLVAVFNLKYLPLGYRPESDEGYLLSMGSRILTGQLPYRDFYYFRTPLSIYIQAALIALFGSHYTILAARAFCTIQSAVLAMVVSSVYYPFVKKLPLLLLLVLSYTVGTLLLKFPWYTYDAVFFATAGLVLFHRRHFFWFGTAVFLAGLCKQNFAAMLLLVPLASAVLRLVRRDFALITLKQTLRFWIGFAAPAAVYCAFLLTTGRLGPFFANVVTLPRECSKMTLSFALFQNHAEAFSAALPLIATTVLLFYANRRRWFLYVGAALAGACFITRTWNTPYSYSYSIVYFTYTVGLLSFIRLNDRDTVADRTSTVVWKTLMVAIIIQYMAGFSYSGLRFSQIGAGAAVALALVLLTASPDLKRPGLAAYLLVALLLVTAIHVKKNYVYQEAPLARLTAPFTYPSLSGVYSSPERVKLFDSMLVAVDDHSVRGDPIFVFPDHPSLYFLTGRRNPTPVGWYYWAEYNDDILREAAEDLRKDPPKLIFIETPSAPDILKDSVLCDYHKIGHYGKLDLLVPGREPGDQD